MSALQEAIAAVNQFDTPENALVCAKVRGLIRGYDIRWHDAGYIPEIVEQTLSGRMYNPSSKGVSQTFDIAGKLDVVAKLGYRRVLIDHKTTSQDISDPNAPYWRQLVVEGQVSHYMLLQLMHGDKCDDAVWDVVRKPGISPKKLSAADRKAVTAYGGRYFGVEISEASRAALIADDRETLELYEIRLAHDCTKERPEWYFARRSIPRMDHEILAYAKEAWQHSQDMIYSREITRKTGELPPRNGGACMLYGSPCKFLGICSGHDTPDSDRWQKKEWKHPELPVIETGRELLTNSRIRCFQTCRRKHYYDFELGIERMDEEEREALFFGHVYHAALEAWWNTFLEVSDEYGRESPVNEIGNITGHTQLAE